MTQFQQLPRSTPEAQGISSSALLAFVAAVEQQIDALHSLMLVRHGQVVAEGWWSPYGPHDPHMLFSLSKSFTATAIGLAVAEGRLTVADRVISFFPEDLPAPVSENLAAMRVHDLLAMATGHTVDTTPYLRAEPDGNWAKAFLARPVEQAPGSLFVYNSGATYMLAAILHKLTGQTLVDYLRPRLFTPLGIDYATWESCPRGINVGGWGLNITTESIARFGQLYLQQGRWGDQQLVPAAWVAAATSKQVANDQGANIDWRQGYGYQFWRCQQGAYRGDGAFGQFCIVMPEQDAVLAITSGVGDMQAVLNQVWTHLLPALGNGALPADPPAQAQLRQRLATLALQPLPAAEPASITPRITGQTYHFAANEQGLQALTLELGATAALLTVQDNAGVHTLVAGHGSWRKGSTTFYRGQARPLAASGAWTAADTYTLKLCYFTMPFCPTITCRFVDDGIQYAFRWNVGFGPTELPVLEGQQV